MEAQLERYSALVPVARDDAISAVVAAAEHRRASRSGDEEDWTAIRDGFERAMNAIFRTFSSRRWRRTPPPELVDAVIELGGAALACVLAIGEDTLVGGHAAPLSAERFPEKPSWNEREERTAVLRAWVGDVSSEYLRTAMAVTNGHPRGALRPVWSMLESSCELASWLLASAGGVPAAAVGSRA